MSARSEPGRAEIPAPESAELSAPGSAELPAPGSAVHLMGVAGAGMRGLAVLLAADGYRVSGCDRNGEEGLEELRAAGVTLHAGHDPAHVEDAALVVYSSAIPEDAPELTAARDRGVPVLKRARALGAYLRGRRLVGIAGTHGKTTITAMTGRALEAAGLQPTVVVGGAVEAWNGYARPGGALAVTEADEFDRSFLELDPSLAVVSSLEPEHLESYGTEAALREAFAVFARRALGRDGVLCCADDPGARALAEALANEARSAGAATRSAGAATRSAGAEDAAGAGDVFTYGFASGADYRVQAADPAPDGSQRCRLEGPEGRVDFLLHMPGEHNVQNAAAALAVALRLGADPRAAAAGLAGFGGVARRLELLAESGGVAVVDDYAHHPTEVRASIDALRRRWPGRRLVVVFQPHLYSRTRDFAEAFAAALGRADRALVLPIFPSREEPIPGVSAERIARADPGRLELAEADDAQAAVAEAVRTAGHEDARPTVFVYMGAGDVTRFAHRAADSLVAPRMVAG